MRFIFSTRSKVPYILKEGTDQKLFGEGYKFVLCSPSAGKYSVVIEASISPLSAKKWFRPKWQVLSAALHFLHPFQGPLHLEGGHRPEALW
jgi:hypothetical protein